MVGMRAIGNAVRVLLILQQDNHEKTWRDWKYSSE